MLYVGMLLICLTAVPLWAQSAPGTAQPGATRATANDQLLSDTRWSESGYGLSLRIPYGAEGVERTRNGAVLALARGDQNFQVFIRKTSEALSLKQLLQEASASLRLAHPTLKLLRDLEPEFRVAGRPATRLTGQIARPDTPGNRGNERVREDLGLKYVFVKIDPNTYVELQVEAPASSFDSAVDIFDALIESVEFASLVKLNEERATLIDAGHHWRDHIDIDRLRKLIGKEHWLRIVEGDKDVGWASVQFKEDTEMNLPGLRILIRRHVELPQATVDTMGDYFESSDGEIEVWSTHSARRNKTEQAVGGRRVGRGANSRNGASPKRPTIQWLETGLRSNEQVGKRNVNSFVNRLAVTQDPPLRQPQALWDGQASNFQQDRRNPLFHGLKWEKPPRGYLSQVELQLMPFLLPLKPGKMGFYCFHSQSATLALRTVRIEKTEDQTIRAWIRPTPHHAELLVEYDRAGTPLRIERFDGRLYVPTSKAELRRIWNIK